MADVYALRGAGARRVVGHDLATFADDPHAFTEGPDVAAGQYLQLGLSVGSQLRGRIVAFHVVDKALEVVVDVEALKAVCEQGGRRQRIRMQTAQYRRRGIGEGQQAGSLNVREVGGAGVEAFKQPRILPVKRLFRFGRPGAHAVVAQAGRVGAQAIGVFDAVARAASLLFDAVGFIFKGQVLRIVMQLQTEDVAWPVRGHRIGVFIRCEVRLPQSGFAGGQRDGLQASNKG